MKKQGSTSSGKVSRRDFLKGMASVSAAAVLPGLGLFERSSEASGRAHNAKPPNILFILVDEMRFPKVFPAGIHTPGQFLRKFMPNTYELWENGVKFANHHTAASACTPARGVIVSGLYAQQTWCVLTLLSAPGMFVSPQPVLDRAFPTYGKLLRQAGYRTPYIGKWHLSVPEAAPGRLEAYGFDGLTYPDPTGVNLEGTFGDSTTNPSLPVLSDDDISNQAAQYLSHKKAGEDPWCLTVGFVNPHDKEFFPAGTEFQKFTDLFSQSQFTQFTDYSMNECGVGVDYETQNYLKDPPRNGYPVVPPNWESLDRLKRTKPAFQTVAHEFMEMVWGGATDDPRQHTFSLVQYPQAQGQPPSPYGIAKAPFSYWQRSLDSYTQILRKLDGDIGQVVAALPRDVARNTIVILTSDHGEYASAHGLISGKTGTFYDEAERVPLIVADPTGRFTGDIDIVRGQLTSSVDILPLLVSLGYNGSRKWIKGDYAQLYGRRHDMLPLLRSARADGRPYVLFTTDESTPSVYNFLGAGNHIVGIRNENAKLAIYAQWQSGTTDIVFDDTLEREFYDYFTPGGVEELTNRPNTLRARVLYELLVNRLIADELQAPLPPSLQPFQAESKERLLIYLQLLDNTSVDAWFSGAGTSILGYGLNVP